MNQKHSCFVVEVLLKAEAVLLTWTIYMGNGTTLQHFLEDLDQIYHVVSEPSKRVALKLALIN